MQIVVYSCITGQYELPKTNQVWGKADWFLFNDGQLPVKKQDSRWNYKKTNNLFSDSRMTGRFYKAIPNEFFPGKYQYSIWLDGSITLKIPPEELVERMENADIMTFKHPVRNCIYQEAKEVLKLKLDYKENVDFHISRLRKENYPENNGLAETKIVVRKNSPRISKFNKEWFYQIMTGSARCQLSFNYVVWKMGINIKYMKPISQQFEDFKQIPHLRKQYHNV